MLASRTSRSSSCVVPTPPALDSRNPSTSSLRAHAPLDSSAPAEPEGEYKVRIDVLPAASLLQNGLVEPCARHDSNVRPLPPQGSALSPELRARGGDSVAAADRGPVSHAVAGAQRDPGLAAASCATRRSSTSCRCAGPPRRTLRGRADGDSCRPRARSGRVGSSRAGDSRRADTGRSRASGSRRAGPPTTPRAQAVACARASCASAGTSVRTYASATTVPSARCAALVTRPTALPSSTSSAS